MGNSLHTILISIAAGVLLLFLMIKIMRQTWTPAKRAMPGPGHLMNRRFRTMLALIGVAYFGMFWVVQVGERERAIEAFQKMELNDARQIARDLERQFQIIQAQLRVIVTGPAISRGGEREKNSLRRYLDLMDKRWVRGLTRVSKEGRILFTTPDEDKTGADISQQPHNQEFLARRKAMVSDPFVSVQGFLALAIIEPVFMKTEFDGWVTALVDTNSLMARFSEPTATGWITRAGLMDRHGVILSDFNPDIPKRTLAEIARTQPAGQALARRILHDEEGTYRYVSEYDLTGKGGKKIPRAGAFARIHLGGDKFWVVGVTAEESAILKSFPTITWPEIAILLLFIAMIVLAAAERLRDEQRYAKHLEHEIAGRMEALRGSEARFTTVLEQSAEAIFLTDTRGLVQYANPACCALTGLSQEEILGRPARRLLEGPGKGAVYRPIPSTLKAGQTWRGHLANRRRDGTAYAVESVISPVYDASGRIAQYISVNRDMTQEMALEAQLRQSQKMEAIGKLAGGVAHDFNNVLTAIVGNLQLAQRLADPRVQKYLRDALTASGRATEMIRQLLTFSRKSPGRREAMDINGLVRETVRLVEKSVDRRIRLVTRLEEDLPAVTADSNQIHQVIMNLCVNARDAITERIENRNGADAGGGNGRDYKITVQTGVERVDGEYCRYHSFAYPGRFVVITLADEGIGMDRETMARIFEPFFTTKGGQGTGLGLSTVYGIVKSHSGWVHVASEPRAGSVFKVYLPTPGTEAESGAAADEAAGGVAEEARVLVEP